MGEPTSQPSGGISTRASLDKDPVEVAAMFDGVARRYDRMNTMMTGGLDRRWRRATLTMLGLRPGERVLDLAAGTAVSTVELARSGAWCVAADFSLGMLQAGAERDVPKVAGDAMQLPFHDDVFDAVTISFGLRNVKDTAAGLSEMLRVTRPGGRIVVCEMSTPVVAKTVYFEYIMRALPALASRFSSNTDAYAYLAESIRAWPNQKELRRIMVDSGWRAVTYRNMAGGIVALHHGVKPVH